MRNIDSLSSTSCICLKTHIKELNGNPTMRLCSMPFLLLPLLLFSIPSPSFALRRANVVYMGVLSHGAEVSEIDLLQVQESHFDLLDSFIGRDIAKESIFYSYTRHINDFAAMLEDEEASAISRSWHPTCGSPSPSQGGPPRQQAQRMGCTKKPKKHRLHRALTDGLFGGAGVTVFFPKNLNPFHCWCRKCGSGKEDVMQEWLTYKGGNCTLVTLALNWVE